jgi:hypothetical protein
MTLFIICVLAIIALGIYVTVNTKPVKSHAPTSLPQEPVIEIEPETPPGEIDLGPANPPKHQLPIDGNLDNKQKTNGQQKSKRKYTKRTDKSKINKKTKQ